MCSAFFNKTNSLLSNEKPRLHSGFTIIELLIVIVIMMIVFFVGLVNYKEFQKRKILEDAALEVANDLRLAQQISLSGTKENTCIYKNYPLVSVEFVIRNNSDYLLRVRCQTGGAGSQVYNLFRYSLLPDYPDEISFQRPYPTVVFLPMGQGVQEDTSVTLNHSGLSDPKVIRVNKGGEIYIE